MNRELDIRESIDPRPLTPVTRRFGDVARGHGCGFRHAGRGGGGCVWAIGEPANIAALREDWRALCSTIAGASVLDTAISPTGIREERFEE